MLRQPTERHGGNARFDEETIMVSKTLASLDAWLALAEEVLAEHLELSEREREVDHPKVQGQLSLFPTEPAVAKGAEHSLIGNRAARHA